jgi:hypothetical protein
LLGDELISDEVMAVVELVKNAYDADAREVTVGLYRSDHPDTACIEVRDNGDGMDLDTVLHAWLEPATERKRRGQRKTRTSLGRYPLGEKGVGRFAADKLGADMELITRARGQEQEVRLHIRWNVFGDARYLDEIENRWEMRAPLAFGGETHGTLLRVTHLRIPCDATMVARVRDGLVQLVSPFSHIHDFRIVFDCPDFPDRCGLVTSGLLKHAPHCLIGSVDAAGLLHTEMPADEIMDLRRYASERFLNGTDLRPPVCGPFRVALFVWDLDNAGLRQAAIDREMRQTLKRSCGISIYRDGFRIWPYGGPGDDWLELNQRRVNNPTMRVSTNQIVGIVEITQEHNPDLRDRTSREGLLDTPSLHDMKALVLGAIARLEERRFVARQTVVAPVPERIESDPVLQLVDQLRTGVRAGQGTAQLLDRVTAVYRQQQQMQDVRQERLMRLASIGLTAEQAMYGIDRTISAASTLLRTARNVASQEKVPAQVTQCLAQLEGYMTHLGEQLDALEPLYAESQSGNRERLDVLSVVQHVATILAFRFHQSGVRLSFETRAPVTVSMARPHLLQVLLHLFDNALYWLTRAPCDQQREIRIRFMTGPPGLIFADNGPGVRAALREHIFQPFLTGRSDGRGLGLYVVKALLDKYGFPIELVAEPQLLAGANFRIVFGKTASQDGRR